jgi:hypothetical protein
MHHNNKFPHTSQQISPYITTTNFPIHHNNKFPHTSQQQIPPYITTTNFPIHHNNKFLAMGLATGLQSLAEAGISVFIMKLPPILL